jgi:starvation-inducible DNA-binding protein
MNPDVAIKPNPTDRVISILNLVLADECLLYTKTRNSHLKATDPGAGALREVFEKQFDELSEIINALSERIRSLGGYPMGTMSDFLQHARLKENSEVRLPALRMAGQLLVDHQVMMRELGGDAEACVQEYGETTVSEFLSGLIARHEAMAQKLRAHLAQS